MENIRLKVEEWEVYGRSQGGGPKQLLEKYFLDLPSMMKVEWDLTGMAALRWIFPENDRSRERLRFSSTEMA
jgi:hypothetical protein